VWCSGEVASARFVWKQAVIALGAIAVVAALVAAVARFSSRLGPSLPSLLPSTARERERARRLDDAVERLRTLQVESAALMPDEARGVYIGLRRDALERLRGDVRPAPGAPPGHVLLQEVLPNGAVVAYLISERLGRVAQVQFLSRLTDLGRLVPHYEALRARYGEPVGFVECPESTESAATRRILWVGREVTVMEAVLLQPGSASLTLAIAGNGDIAAALRRLGCRPVDRDAGSPWPVARTVGGERFPIQAPSAR